MKEPISHCSDIVRVETTYWKRGQKASSVEGVEEINSHCSDIARVEASDWKRCQRALIVEPREEIISYTGPTCSEIRK
ncbi:MAG: hypothetical protein LBI53_03675 [Candidatus Peribacteria bacterium]|nr:hypothetical protein [Candidatus Peribacteria bacterium]